MRKLPLEHRARRLNVRSIMISMDPNETNPYQPPETDGSQIVESPKKSRILSLVISLGILFVLTAMLAPPDTGIWLNWALTIEFSIYGIYLLVQMFALTGRNRDNAIRIGPTFFFIASVVTVVAWTVAVENNVLPNPHDLP